MTITPIALAWLGSDLPSGVLDAAWVKLPVQLLLAGGSVLVSVLLLTATVTLSLQIIRWMRPSLIRAWWQSGPGQITELSAGALGTTVGMKFALKDAEDDARDLLAEAHAEQVALLTQLTQLLLSERASSDAEPARRIAPASTPEEEEIPVQRRIARRIAIQTAMRQREATAEAARGQLAKLKHRRGSPIR